MLETGRDHDVRPGRIQGLQQRGPSVGEATRERHGVDGHVGVMQRIVHVGRLPDAVADERLGHFVRRVDVDVLVVVEPQITTLSCCMIPVYPANACRCYCSATGRTPDASVRVQERLRISSEICSAWGRSSRVVIFMLVRSRPRWRPGRRAGSRRPRAYHRSVELGSREASSYARRMVSNRNACGVCARNMFARSRDGAHDLAVAQILGEQHRVGGGECDRGCLELVQRGDAAVDRGLLDERTHRVVDQQFRAGRDASCPQRLQSRRSAVGAFGAAVDDHAHLRVAGLIDQAFHFIAPCGLTTTMVSVTADSARTPRMGTSRRSACRRRSPAAWGCPDRSAYRSRRPIPRRRPVLRVLCHLSESYRPPYDPPCPIVTEATLFCTEFFLIRRRTGRRHRCQHRRNGLSRFQGVDFGSAEHLSAFQGVAKTRYREY